MVGCNSRPRCTRRNLKRPDPCHANTRARPRGVTFAPQPIENASAQCGKEPVPDDAGGVHRFRSGQARALRRADTRSGDERI